MKKQIFTLLLFSAASMQCSEELPVSEDYPIVFTTKAIPNDRGFRFEGKLIDNSGYKILTYGFVYAPSSGYEIESGAIVYELGSPGDETFTLNTPSIGTAPTYAYRAFVTYMKNSKKITVYGNNLLVDSKAKGDYPVWSLRIANETLRGTGDGIAVVSQGGYHGGYIIQRDGKVTVFGSSTPRAQDFPLNASQPDAKLYCNMPFVITSQDNNLYRLLDNGSWAIITQLPFDHDKLATGNIFMGQYGARIYIFGSFGTYIYNYWDNTWEEHTALPLSPGQAIVTGANIYDFHYILTTDGQILRAVGTSAPSLLTTFPGQLEDQTQMFLAGEGQFLYVFSGQKMWEFNTVFGEWKEAAPFPEALNHPIYFINDWLCIANKKANGNYDIWALWEF